jgi:hypothetical protein
MINCSPRKQSGSVPDDHRPTPRRTNDDQHLGYLHQRTPKPLLTSNLISVHTEEVVGEWARAGFQTSALCLERADSGQPQSRGWWVLRSMNASRPQLGSLSCPEGEGRRR